MGKRTPDEKRRSAFALVKLLLRPSRDLLDSHRREFLRTALYKVTEAEAAKYQTRYRSEESLSSTRPDWQHEHVYQRAAMVDRLLKAAKKDIDRILATAIGCVVTKAEHRRLNKVKGLDGWRRYAKAGIVVIDTKSGRRLNLTTRAPRRSSPN
ncbi:MAG: hypothetical protein FJX54_03340 [Alphaproteobacteria bacterium]|nr:hypothetical protein [Alphaproteobacteria bacterium]